MPDVITLSKLGEYVGKGRHDLIGNGDYYIRRIESGNVETVLPAIKVDGMVIFTCTVGSIKLSVNFRTTVLTPGSVLVLSPNDMIEFQGHTTAVKGYSLYLPIEFLKALSLDSNTLSFRNVDLDALPVIKLTSDILRLFEGYFNLLELNATVNSEPTLYTRNISRSVVSGMIYQIMAIAKEQKAQSEGDAEKSENGSRKQYYVRDFMSLLHEHFRQERSVGYYAGRLFISAKYLSLIIKEATGRTATEWIDHFVILEAKNLLRYSGRNVQQIAYDLNFHNQSAFGKYFKHLTGMSPSEFRKS